MAFELVISTEQREFVLLKSDSYDALEDLRTLVGPYFENSWINDLSPIGNLNEPMPMAGGSSPMKKELHAIISSNVLPNGGVLVHSLVDGLHEYIESAIQRMRQGQPPRR